MMRAPGWSGAACEPGATRRAARPLTEKEFQQQVIDLARLMGFRVYHTFDARRSESGFPDLCMVRGDRLIFAELKTETGTLSEAQREWLHDLDMVGTGGRPELCGTNEVYLWRPSQWSEIEQTLKRGRA